MIIKREPEQESFEAELTESGINISITGDKIDRIQSVTIYFKGWDDDEQYN